MLAAAGAAAGADSRVVGFFSCGGAGAGAALGDDNAPSDPDVLASGAGFDAAAVGLSCGCSRLAAGAPAATLAATRAATLAALATGRVIGTKTTAFGFMASDDAFFGDMALCALALPVASEGFVARREPSFAAAASAAPVACATPARGRTNGAAAALRLLDALVLSELSLPLLLSTSLLLSELLVSALVLATVVVAAAAASIEVPCACACDSFDSLAPSIVAYVPPALAGEGGA